MSTTTATRSRSPHAIRSVRRTPLLLADLPPGQLAVFLVAARFARRRGEYDQLALETDAAHLVAADAARVGSGIDAGDQTCPVECVVAAIGTVVTGHTGRHLAPSVADDRLHAPVGGEGDAADALAAVGLGQ